MIIADGKRLSKAITTFLIKKTICIFVVSYLKTKSYEKNNRHSVLQTDAPRKPHRRRSVKEISGTRKASINFKNKKT